MLLLNYIAYSDFPIVLARQLFELAQLLFHQAERQVALQHRRHGLRFVLAHPRSVLHSW